VLADGHVLGHVAAGLAEEPDGSAVYGAAKTGADEAAGACGFNGLCECRTGCGCMTQKADLGALLSVAASGWGFPAAVAGLEAEGCAEGDGGWSEGDGVEVPVLALEVELGSPAPVDVEVDAGAVGVDDGVVGGVLGSAGSDGWVEVDDAVADEEGGVGMEALDGVLHAEAAAEGLFGDGVLVGDLAAEFKGGNEVPAEVAGVVGAEYAAVVGLGAVVGGYPDPAAEDGEAAGSGGSRCCLGEDRSRCSEGENRSQGQKKISGT
jgi:hypothetical protein